MHQGYVMAPTVSDTGGPNELDTTEHGRGGPLLLLDRVVVEPARSADELVHSALSFVVEDADASTDDRSGTHPFFLMIGGCRIAGQEEHEEERMRSSGRWKKPRQTAWSKIRRMLFRTLHVTEGES